MSNNRHLLVEIFLQGRTCASSLVFKKQFSSQISNNFWSKRQPYSDKSNRFFLKYVKCNGNVAWGTLLILLAWAVIEYLKFLHGKEVVQYLLN